jgi:Dolichyl-phosphate-mannose-protein mannosyltransferase
MPSFFFWIIVMLYGPWAIWARTYFLNNALLEPHPWRQTQTALTILQLFEKSASVWDYRSPLEGMLWNNVYEFPMYQWVVTQVMRMGIPLEVAARAVTLVSFALGAVFAFLLVKEFFGGRVAKWFLLIYWVNPFGVIFSRVCLIDFFALAGTLGSVYALVKIRSGKNRAMDWSLFALGGIAGGLAKINIWFFITAAVLGVMVWESLQNKNRAKWQLGVSIVLFLQVALIVTWNFHRSHHLHSPADTPWLIGEFHHRFELWRWKKILWDFLVRSVFFDWLTIPFLFGSVILFKKSRVLFGVCFGVVLCHTLIFFQVQTYHDYYLISSLPYLFTATALGMDSLFENVQGAKKIVAFSVLVLLVFKFTQLRYYYAPISYDYRTELAQILELKRHTDPSDIIYWDAHQGRFEIATYSQRKVGLSETSSLIGKKTSRGENYFPSVYHFDSKFPAFTLMDFSKTIWLDGSRDFVIYRTRNAGDFFFSPLKHISVLSSVPEGSKVSTFQSFVENCGSASPLLMAIPEGTRAVKVLDSAHQLIGILPGNKKIINLPSQGEWGCRFNLEITS